MIFKVGSDTNSGKLAGAIAAEERKGTNIVLYAVGAGAVNQAVKAVAIARGFLIPSGVKITIDPSFNTVKENGKEQTSIKLELRRL